MAELKQCVPAATSRGPPLGALCRCGMGGRVQGSEGPSCVGMVAQKHGVGGREATGICRGRESRCSRQPCRPRLRRRNKELHRSPNVRRRPGLALQTTSAKYSCSRKHRLQLYLGEIQHQRENSVLPIYVKPKDTMGVLPDRRRGINSHPPPKPAFAASKSAPSIPT